MPKTRSYSRQELQSLRRADLQKLCKTYDIKGANAKSEQLIETLANFFTSSAYLASPRADRARARPQPKAGAQSRTLHALPRRGAAAKAKPALKAGKAHDVAHVAVAVAAAAPRSPPPATQSSLVPVTAAAAAPATTAAPELTDAAPQAQPQPANAEPARAAANTSSQLLSQPPDADVPALRQQVDRLTNALADLQRDQSLLIERALEATVEQHLQALIQRQLAVVEEREAAVKKREDELDLARRQWERMIQMGACQRCPNCVAKSQSGMTSSSPEKRRREDEDVAAHKRARLASVGESSFSTLLDAHPRTPPPHPASATSAFPSTPGAQPPDEHQFATTPRPPTEQPSPSPTIDRFDQILHRAGSPSTVRKTKATKARAVTSTHASPRQGPRQLPVPFLSTTFMRKGAVSPPALSPSPSIGSGSATFTPMSMPSSSAPAAHEHQAAPNPRPAARGAGVTLPSPRREYMDVALNGFGPSSPGDMATPGSRTMLGTERYRDTRFGDEPFVPWSSPTVDCGPPTP